MPPRLSHHKSRLGCNRCKARKVKCDEAKPKCSACKRHDVSCDYPAPGTVHSEPRTAPSEARTAAVTVTNGHHSPAHANGAPQWKDDMLELQLMHEWSAYVCESLCTTWRFWRYQAPAIAFKFRFVLDAMLALSALHASRQKPRRWITTEGRMESLDDGRINSMPLPANALRAETEWVGIEGEPPPSHPPPEADRDLTVFDAFHMLHISRLYFNRALEGQRATLLRLDAENARAAFMCSNLVSYYALFTLSEDNATSDLPAHDPVQWFRLAHGTVLIVTSWMSFAREDWVQEAGAMHGAPDLTDEKELFAPQHREIFAYLLEPLPSSSPSSSPEVISAEDREGYEQALSYLGIMYKNLISHADAPLATVRRVAAMPARLWGRFPQLVLDARPQPRALAVLAHVFAALTLVADHVPWCKGIAERQVPVLAEMMPPEYRVLVAWPLRVVRGERGPPGL